MALEVGRLVARLELDTRKFEQDLARARKSMGDTRRAAEDLDSSIGDIGKSSRRMDDATKSASRLDDSLKKTANTGRGMTVSDAPKRQLAETQSVAQKLDGQLGKVGLSLGALGTMAGIGGLAAGMSAVIKQGNELTNNLNTLRAAGAATDAQMAQISDTAKQLGADNTIVGASAGSAAAAMTELVKGGMSVDQTMQAARGTLQLAAAAQIEAAQAATIQSAALQAFSLSAGDAGRVSDILANAANASSAEIGDVAAAMQQSGTVAHQFGVDIDDTATAIAMFANAGIKGSDAGTLLKTALLALTDQGNPAQGAIEELGLSVYDLEGKFVGLPSLFDQLATAQSKMSDEAYQAATATLFGSDAMRLAGIAAQQGSAGFNTLNEAINRQGGAAEMAEAKTRGLPGAINNLQNQAETAAVSLYELVDGPLADLADFSADGIEKVPGALKAVADAAAPVGTAVGGALSVIPGDVQAALAALVALRVTGLGDSLTSRVVSTGGTMRSLGETLALTSMYARDSVTANGVMGASMQGVGKIAGGMKTALGGVVSMLGGPWMIGLAAAGLGVSRWMQSNAEAAQAVAQHKADVDTLATSLDQVTGAVTEATRATEAKKLADEGAFAAGREFGLSEQTITNAAMGNADAQRTVDDAMRARLATTAESIASNEVLRENIERGGITVGDFTNALMLNQGALDKLSAAGIDTGWVLRHRTEDMVTLSDAVGASNGRITEAQTKFNELAAATGKAGLTAQTTSEAMRLMGDAIVSVPDNKTVVVSSLTDPARAELERLGFTIDAIPGSKDLKVTSPGALDLITVLETLGMTVTSLPGGHIEITDTTDENIAAINALTGKVHEPKNGTVTINSADVDRARGHVDGLNNIKTQSTHTVIIGTVNRGGNDASTAGITVGQHYADGGIRSFADGGTLPGQAAIERPHGARGLVQWAEAETGGEAFIPLAPAKRKRSLSIWAETGRMLGIDIAGLGDIASFANGGVVEGMTGLVGKKFPALKATSTYRTSNDNHGAGKAADFSNGYYNTPEQLALANYIADNFPDSLELIYSHPGFNRNIKNGKFVGDGVGFYGAGTMAGHRNHVHWAMSEPPSEAKAKSSTLGGAAVDNRTTRQKNIDAIVAEGKRRNLSDRDIQIALMTAEQESGIKVLANNADPASLNMPNEGVGADHDSTGIFQQRNNGAWGTLEDRMDPTKSAGMFYDELAKVQNRESLSLAAAAQAVQKSAYPDAYAKHEAKAASELSASKARIESMGAGTSGATAGGQGMPVYVTNWPGSGVNSSGPGVASQVEATIPGGFIEGMSVAGMIANAVGRPDLVKVEQFANGGFSGLENHTAQIVPGGSWRVWGEPETGGEAYIPLASHKRARSTVILAETAKRFGYKLGAGINLAGSMLLGGGLDTGWGGPSLSDIGIDGGAALETYSAQVQQAAQLLVQAGTGLMEGIDSKVDGTLAQVDAGKSQLRQAFSGALI